MCCPCKAISWVAQTLGGHSCCAVGPRFVILLAGSALQGPLLGVAFSFWWLFPGFALLCLLLGVNLFCWLLARSALLGPSLSVTFQFCWLLVGFALLVVLLGVAFKFSWLLTGSALLVLLEGVAFQFHCVLLAAGWWLGLLLSLIHI